MKLQKNKILPKKAHSPLSSAGPNRKPPVLTISVPVVSDFFPPSVWLLFVADLLLSPPSSSPLSSCYPEAKSCGFDITVSPRRPQSVLKKWLKLHARAMVVTIRRNVRFFPLLVMVLVAGVGRRSGPDPVSADLLQNLHSGVRMAGKLFGIDTISDVADLVAKGFSRQGYFMKPEANNSMQQQAASMLVMVWKLLGLDGSKLGALVMNALIFVAHVVSVWDGVQIHFWQVIFLNQLHKTFRSPPIWEPWTNHRQSYQTEIPQNPWKKHPLVAASSSPNPHFSGC